jgi:protocatechuate 3,4-dioxygenase beta subunit
VGSAEDQYQKQEIMKTIVLIATGIVLLFGSEVNNMNPIANVVSDLSKLSTLNDDDEPIIVRGHVRNQSGTAITGAAVKLRKNGVVTYQTTTDNTGFYKMTGVQAGDYVLQLSATGYVTKAINLSISAEINRTDTLIAE